MCETHFITWCGFNVAQNLFDDKGDYHKNLLQFVVE